MQMKQISPGQIVILCSTRGTYNRDNPHYWAKATVVATKEPLPERHYSRLFRSFKPTGVRLKLQPIERERYGKHAAPRSDLGTTTQRVTGWAGVETSMRGHELEARLEELPEDEVIVPARMVMAPWDDTVIDAWHQRQAEGRQYRQEREAERQAKSNRLQELLAALGSDLKVPDHATGMAFKFDDLIPILERAVQQSTAVPVIPIPESTARRGRPL
jgi:hypothetical protein